MLIVALVSGLFQVSDPAAPPSDDEFRSALIAKVPDAVIASIEVWSSPAGGMACGTARIGGAVEPFAVVFRRQEDTDASVSVVFPDGRAARAPRHSEIWRIVVQAPYLASSDSLDMSAHSRLQWDALSRRGALELCPKLTPPEGVVWTTEVEPDPSRTPEERERARRLARSGTDLIFGSGQQPRSPAR